MPRSGRSLQQPPHPTERVCVGGDDGTLHPFTCFLAPVELRVLRARNVPAETAGSLTGNPQHTHGLPTPRAPPRGPEPPSPSPSPLTSCPSGAASSPWRRLSPRALRDATLPGPRRAALCPDGCGRCALPVRVRRRKAAVRKQGRRAAFRGRAGLRWAGNAEGRRRRAVGAQLLPAGRMERTDRTYAWSFRCLKTSPVPSTWRPAKSGFISVLAVAPVGSSLTGAGAGRPAKP